jgi:polysaccharide deacetylase 2 family uncharacterized protein YibQ
MFARPRATAPGSASAPAAPGEAMQRVMRLAGNPFVGAGLAAGAFVLAAATLVMVTADPHAGAPSVRVKLDSPPPAETAPLRAETQGPAAVDPAAAPGPDGAAAPAGQAVITLPQGAHVVGATGAPAPAAAFVAKGPPLVAAPIAGLTQPGPGGPLPVIGKDGRTPFSAYARPFTGDGKPRVALVVGGLGLNAVATKAAIERLPPEITLSFVPYADGLQGWIDQARAAGHEVILEIPMEPLDYPNNDPGPYTLMAQSAPQEFTRRLEWLLSRASGYFAVTNYLGGRFLQTEPAMATFAQALKARGVGFIDDGSARKSAAALGPPRASADTIIDQDLASDSIDRQLTALEATALSKGQSLGVGFAYPVTVGQVARWAAGLAGRGYQLAPASAIAHR